MAVAVRQSNVKQAAFAASQTLAFTASTLAGSTLVCYAGNFATASTVTGISDAVNGAWTRLGTDAVATSGTGGDAALAVFYIENASSITSAQSVTVASGVGDQWIVVAELTGVATATSIDPASYASGTGVAVANAPGATSVANSLTTTLATGDLYLAGVTEGNLTPTWSNNGGANWSTVQSQTSTTFVAGVLYAKTVGSDAAGTYSLTISMASTNVAAGKMVAFQPAAGGAAPALPVAHYAPLFRN